MTNKFLHLIALLAILSCKALAQSAPTAFRAYLYNEEFAVYLRINFYDKDVSIPGQDIYGPLPGYLGKDRYSFYWPVVAAEVKGNKATMTMVNDYGSEDLTAVLTQKNDSVYELKQLEGSPLKMPNNRKWQKLPKLLELKRK